ncbi:bacillithiol system redox-active protein YtxJ [Psychroflexus planctonicus]|uniref:Thioredoxin family protein n=1 Tax=Psychroflexus planctonicus TaxID=1526575 RepID=A0ABQ1SLR6_9FLAO|nr:bacillithiol system redox-active protein YtxJ [Psychroflexus planctonicus]GGE42943.1 thioredoxin family protein [Psychroflexus planctonicus]
MGLFKNLFSSNNESKEQPQNKPNLDWYKLTKVEQLDNLKQISNEKLVVIFKHSTRCGISRMVWNQFQAGADFPKEQVELFYLDLLSYRDVSDAITQDFQVLHQSPQLILLQHEEVVHHASHSAIVPSSVNSFLST